MFGLPVDALGLVALIAAALVAGWVDAVVGGGGLIQLPALLLGLPAATPVPVISGTNKVSSIAGTTTASINYARRIRLHWPSALVLVACAALGSALGAQLVRFLPKQYFTPIVLVVLIGVGFYTWRKPALGLVSVEKRSGWAKLAVAAGIGVGVGAYDGFLGPGTGTFFVILLVALLGYGFLEASAYAKLANLATNAAAIIVFALHGQVIWLLGLLMAVANLTGGFVGSWLAVRYGNAFVRRVFLLVVGGLILKLAYDTAVLALHGFRG